MRDGPFEVILQNNLSKQPFEESEGFVLGHVGEEYHIRVIVHRDPTTKDFPFEQKTIKVGLYVDNIDVQYWKRLGMCVGFSLFFSWLYFTCLYVVCRFKMRCRENRGVILGFQGIQRWDQNICNDVTEKSGRFEECKGPAMLGGRCGVGADTC